jgi:L-rhamnose mutarotase
MQRFAFTMTIKPDRVDVYVACHRAVWPTALDAIRRSGIQRYSIFLECNKLFFFVEAEDVAAAFRYLDADPEHARWNREVTAGMFEGSLDVGSPAGLPEVFRFDAGESNE